MCNDFPKPQPLNLNVGNTSVASPQMRHDTDPLALSLKSALWPEGAGKGWTRISPMATCPTEHIWDWVRVKLEDWVPNRTYLRLGEGQAWRLRTPSYVDIYIYIYIFGYPYHIDSYSLLVRVDSCITTPNHWLSNSRSLGGGLNSSELDANSWDLRGLWLASWMS
jgi:hypothetical protein